MPVIAQDRPLETFRAETVDRLIMNFSHGRLSLEAFERRLDEALDAAGHESLETLTADLDLDVDADYLARKQAQPSLQYPYRAPKTVEHIVNVFSAGGRSGAWTAPDEIRVFTIFGATNLDLSGARFVSKETRVKVFCLFGAIDIFVHENVSTSVKAVCLFGAIDNRVPATEDHDASRLAVEGLVLFGALDAKIHTTLKDKLLVFATTLRQMFGSMPPQQPGSRAAPRAYDRAAPNSNERGERTRNRSGAA